MGKRKKFGKLKKLRDTSYERLLKPSQTSKPENDSKKTKNLKTLLNQIKKHVEYKNERKQKFTDPIISVQNLSGRT